MVRTFDKLKNSFKVVCSEEAIPEIVAVLSDLSNHIKIFKKELLRVKVKASK